MLHRVLGKVHAPPRMIRTVEQALVLRERRRFIVGPGTIGATSQRVEENRFIWDRWD
jgi:hypothetical protein